LEWTVLRRIICTLFGHEWRETPAWSVEEHRVGWGIFCLRCGKQKPEAKTPDSEEDSRSS
jgi:hypothetical protein